MTNHGRATTPYGQGYLAGHMGKERVAPATLTEIQREKWLQGYEDAWRASIDSKRRPGQRPSMTR